jgi:hypothetical protein
MMLVFGTPNPITGNMVCARMVLKAPEDPREFTQRLKTFCGARLEKKSKVPGVGAITACQGLRRHPGASVEAPSGRGNPKQPSVYPTAGSGAIRVAATFCWSSSAAAVCPTMFPRVVWETIPAC